MVDDLWHSQHISGVIIWVSRLYKVTGTVILIMILSIFQLIQESTPIMHFLKWMWASIVLNNY